MIKWLTRQQFSIIDIVIIVTVIDLIDWLVG